MHRLTTAALAVVVLAVATGCNPGVPEAGTVTDKGITTSRSGQTTNKCHWIKVRHDDGTSSRGCVPIRRWKKATKGGQWLGK
ncbi:hypothetical protein [Kribbella sp. NPDC050470]|uniref:hypothetical protein n=1 Tax=unclassified Kribbella TaxID=2644121 RepID=UPI0037B1DDCE